MRFESNGDWYGRAAVEPAHKRGCILHFGSVAGQIEPGRLSACVGRRCPLPRKTVSTDMTAGHCRRVTCLLLGDALPVSQGRPVAGRPAGPREDAGRDGAGGLVRGVGVAGHTRCAPVAAAKGEAPQWGGPGRGAQQQRRQPRQHSDGSLMSCRACRMQLCAGSPGCDCQMRRHPCQRGRCVSELVCSWRLT